VREGLIEVRATISLPGLRCGEVAWVDPADPYVTDCLAGGHLVPLAAGSATLPPVLDLAAIPFRQAKTYGAWTGSSPRRIDLLVTHTAAEKPDPHGAEGLQNYFATMPDGRVASAHFNVDSDSITQSVRVTDMAWHAPGANFDGIGTELIDLYEPSAGDWQTAYATAMLDLVADLYAALCVKYRIPPVWLGPADLLAGRRGVTTHRAVSEAFRRSDHMDPGAAFPVGTFMPLLKARIAGHPAGPPVGEWPNLYQGDGLTDDGKRVWVRRLQVMLDQLPYVRLSPQDGRFGPQTKAAVTQFQRRAGVWATGNVGPPTWAALKLAVHKDGMTDAERRVVHPAA
jgi:N-acetyl-anhydromuramyl-L-alanine amidase AmpD